MKFIVICALLTGAVFGFGCYLIKKPSKEDKINRIANRIAKLYNRIEKLNKWNWEK